MGQATQSTTSEDLYKVILSDVCSRYSTYVLEDLDRFKVSEYSYNGDLGDLIRYKETLDVVLSRAKSYVVPTINIDIPFEIQKTFNNDVAAYEQLKSEVETNVSKFRRESLEEYQMKSDNIRRAAKGTVKPLVEKHERLLSYKDKLRGVMTHYGITPNDIEVSPDITRAEFEALLDTALQVCENTEGKAQALIRKVVVPLEDESLVAGLYSVCLFLGSWLLLPIVSVVYIGSMIKNTKTMYANMDKLRIAESLMHSVDFDKFIPNDEQYIVPDYDDTDVEAEIAQELSDLEAANPQARIDEELRKFRTTEGLEYMTNAIEGVVNTAKKKHGELVADLTKRAAETQDLINEELSKQKKFGDYMNSSTVMDTNFIIGMQNGVIPVKQDFGMTNINFVGTYTPEMLDMVKVMFVNALMSVRANSLEVAVYDVEYLGQGFAEFVTPKTNPYLTIHSKDFSKVQEEMQKHASENILAIKTKSILEFNKESEALGMVTRQYYLYILLTGLGDKLHENKPFMEFLKYSATAGVMVWVVYPQQIQGCMNLKPPFRIEDGAPLHYDFDLGSRAVGTFEYALEHNKSAALDYRKGYLLKYLPEDKWWSKSGNKGINIRFGLENGDPSKAYTLAFDDKNVHCLLGGATGAGKSVTIDCTMQNMLHEYAPDELQLVYIDMKNAEVAKYTKDGYCLIPHCIIAAGTTDGEYCLSIFDWALEEMLRRYNICRKYGVQKVEDLRKKYDDPSREDYDPEVHIPRIVLLIDEFQVMFDSSRIPAKIIDKINGRITSMVKLARAASMHMWFTSQEMSGTLSKNVLDNFSTRGALRCSKDVSSTLLGNPASGTIREKVGWMYSNDSAGQDPNANKMWRVPYAPVDDLMQGIYELRDKAQNENRLCLRAKFFDEKEGRTVEDFKAAYEAEPNFKDPYFFVMGERTIYSTKSTPVNFKMQEDDKENVYAAAFERQDAMDLIGTFIDNIVMKEDRASLLINCADKDTSYLLNLPQYIPEGWEDFLPGNYEVESILDDLDAIGEAREEQDYEEIKPLYIMFLMWEKKSGIGTDENYKLLDALVKEIKRLNGLKVHFIFISREKGVPKSLTNLCNHKVCAKADESTAVSVVDDTAPFKFPGPNGDEACFALYKYGSDASKFKIYRHVLERKLEAREI